MAPVAHPISRPTFNTLPNEIIGAVCSHLPFDSCRQVVLISRRLKAICEPHLYHDIHFQIRNKGRREDKLRFNILFDDFGNRPELRLYVKILKFETPRDYERRDELLPLPPSMHHLDLDSPTADGDLDLRHLPSLETLRQTQIWKTKFLSTLSRRRPKSDQERSGFVTTRLLQFLSTKM